MQKKLLTWTMIGGMAFSAMPAMADPDERPGAEDMVADVLVARPIGLLTTVVGSAAFVVSLPFSALGGNVDEAADALVVGPARSTFVRCLGCTNTGKRVKAPE